MCSTPLSTTKPHSVAPQWGTTFQPSTMPTGAQMSMLNTLVWKLKRTSPLAFLATMFQPAWMSPASRISANAERGTGSDQGSRSPTGRRATKGPEAPDAFQWRPTMAAVAISSSSNASETLPETLYGSSSGFSEYFSSVEALSLERLTCPMVQPPKRRSKISS